jgi:hypothetical protein
MPTMVARNRLLDRRKIKRWQLAGKPHAGAFEQPGGDQQISAVPW